MQSRCARRTLPVAIPQGALSAPPVPGINPDSHCHNRSTDLQRV